VADQIGRVEVNAARDLATNLISGRAALRRYVEVNVPAFELRLVEDGRVTYRSRVIVGDEDKPTPIFDDWMRYIDLNPSWYVPRSIEQEILDKEAKEPGYMSKAGFVWQAAGAGAPPRLVQRPGPENALGRLKFVFPNRNSVYIHDTPNRGLFNRSDRTLSHGCIRLEQPLGLAAALLKAQGWDQVRLDAALQTSTTHRVRLDAPVPVFLDYRTATLDGEGRLMLWPDIYGLDEEGVTHFPMKGLPPEQEPAPPQPEAPPAQPETVADRQAPPPSSPAPVAGL
jgi:murein L,D-transpeptidase YcbB/YkuD